MTKKNRFKKSDISLERLHQGLLRRVADIPESVKWFLPLSSTIKNKKRIDSLRNKHLGGRCFIIANGPSIGKMDLSLLKNEFTIGMNRVYLLFEKLDVNISYYVAINKFVLEQFSSDIQKLTMPKFINWNRRQLFDIENSQNYFLKMRMNIADKFSSDLCKSISSGGTVTFTALQIAYYLGFQTVILIGLDHSFSDKGLPNSTEVRLSDEDKNHFHPNYFPKGYKWQLPDLRRSELAYETAREFFKKSGRQIYDATINGKCDVFEKIEYSTIFGTSNK